MQLLPSIAPSGISLSWADRLALSRMPAPTIGAAVLGAEYLATATARLWTPFEEAVAQANRALAQRGLKDRLTMERTGGQRWISFAGLEGRERAISVFITAHARNGQIAGGAVLTTSHLRTAIYVSPVMAADDVHWVVPATGMPFTAEMVNDLFLSVFGNDPVVTGSFTLLSGPSAPHERTA